VQVGASHCQGFESRNIKWGAIDYAWLPNGRSGPLDPEPILRKPLDDGDAVPLQIDSGSSEIFKDSANNSDPATAPTVNPTFGDGTLYSGQVTKADVRVGPVSSASKIDIQVVDKASCSQGAAGTACKSGQDNALGCVGKGDK
jgi:hypothetical protein